MTNRAIPAIPSISEMKTLENELRLSHSEFNKLSKNPSISKDTTGKHTGMEASWNHQKHYRNYENFSVLKPSSTTHDRLVAPQDQEMAFDLEEQDPYLTVPGTKTQTNFYAQQSDLLCSDNTPKKGKSRSPHRAAKSALDVKLEAATSLRLAMLENHQLVLDEVDFSGVMVDIKKLLGHQHKSISSLNRKMKSIRNKNKEELMTHKHYSLDHNIKVHGLKICSLKTSGSPNPKSSCALQDNQKERQFNRTEQGFYKTIN